MRWGVFLAIGTAAIAVIAPPATAQDPADITTGLLRQICDLQWIEGACEATGYPEPQYASSDDPSPGQPLALRVGAVHNHSGYSDDDLTNTRPAD